jgi:hypothetical protein
VGPTEGVDAVQQRISLFSFWEQNANSSNTHCLDALPTELTRLSLISAWCYISCQNSHFCCALKLYGLSPRANYTDRATAACRRSDCQLVRIEGAMWSAWQIPPAVFSVSRQEPLLFYQEAPQFYSRGWVDLVPDSLLFSFFFPPPENLVVPGIEPGPPDL